MSISVIAQHQHNMKDTSRHNMNNMQPARPSGGKDSNMSMMNMNQSTNLPSTGVTKQYDLYVKDTMVNYTGRHRHAIAVNGQIPAPTVELTEGDTAIIRVHNLMKVTTSIHWHGILIPNQFDGVPGLTTFPIKPDSTLRVVFPVRQNGTYWYHSHTMTQEQNWFNRFYCYS